FAFLSFYELSICATGLATPTAYPHAHYLGLLLAAVGLLSLAVSEAVSHVELFRAGRIGSEHLSRWASDFRTAAGRFAIMATVVAEFLALVDIEQAWQSGMIFVLGAIGALWSTRVMRLSVLVYVGLIQLAAGALDLTWWITPVGHTEIRIGWVALAA